MHPNVARVAQILDRAGVDSTVRELDDSTRTAADAAAALGCEVGAIANSLIFMADGEPILVLTSGSHRVDTAVLAGRIGVSRLSRATPEQVREATGQPIGGVAPVGHPQPVRTVIDRALADYPQIWAAAGTPRSVFNTTYADLAAISGAMEVEVV